MRNVESADLKPIEKRFKAKATTFKTRQKP